MKRLIALAAVLVVAGAAYAADAPEPKYYARIGIAADVPQRLVQTFREIGRKEFGPDARGTTGTPDKSGMVHCSIYRNTNGPVPLTEITATAARLMAAAGNIADMKGLAGFVTLSTGRLHD